MRKIWKEICFAIFMAFVMPWLVLRLTPVQEQVPVETTIASESTVPVLTEQGVIQMPLDVYLTGVLLCELPGDFHMQAKMAQAVVARTYTLRTVAVKEKHPDKAVCTDPSCCQGYRSVEDYLAMGGTQTVVEEAEQAVKNTRGWVLTYGGELIDATYFSCSGGQTEDALAVWGADIPYLQSVVSPGEEEANHYRDQVIFTPEQLQKALGIKLGGDPGDWFGKTAYTRGGGVEYMYIGAIPYSGTTLRSALGLRSTAFSVEVKEKQIIFSTKGFGHRVGMSQYGADAMARQGTPWQEILTHYYVDTVLEQR